MKHTMNLKEAPFRMIQSRKKRYELRLYDEKRRQLRVGDEILFCCGEERLTVEIKALHRYPSFEALYRSLPLTEIGYLPEETGCASPEDMRAYYSAEEEQRLGVLAIELMPI